MKIGKKALYALLLTFLSAPLRAEPHISARVSASDITLNDSITLTVEISGVGNISAAPALNIPGFNVERAGQTQSYQWVNGQTSSLVSYNFILTPVSSGNFKIPAITLEHEGKTYTTESIDLIVRAADPSSQNSAGSQAPPEGARSVDVPSEGLKPVFITAKVDHSKVVVGEPVLLSIQFLRRPQLRISGQPRYVEPDTTGFLVEPLKQLEYTSVINGAQYNVNEIRYALFPTSDGEFAIGSASIDVPVMQSVDAFDPNSFFQQFFGRQQVMKLTTRAIPIQVRALPKNKPLNFSGAVGRYKITSLIENMKDQPEVGKPLNLIVTVQGVGNIKALKEPTLPEMNAFRRYDTITDSKINNDGKFIHGSKDFKILIIPQVSGQVSIPPIPYVFYNPDVDQFQTEWSKEITLQVKPGAVSASAPEDAIASIQSSAPTEGVRVIEKSIRYIKQGHVHPIKPPLLNRPSFYIFNSLPLLFAIGAMLTRWRSTLLEKNASLFRVRGAKKTATKKLRNARKLLNGPDPIPFYSALHDAITKYVADKMQASPHGLVWEDVERRLQEKGVQQETLTALRTIKDEADMIRYATSEYTSEMKQASLTNAEIALEHLEEVLE